MFKKYNRYLDNFLNKKEGSTPSNDFYKKKETIKAERTIRTESVTARLTQKPAVFLGLTPTPTPIFFGTQNGSEDVCFPLKRSNLIRYQRKNMNKTTFNNNNSNNNSPILSPLTNIIHLTILFTTSNSLSQSFFDTIEKINLEKVSI